jgi:flavin reductase (DIM6/NTAB) family NADH-FMN oxidoreductase RutF
MAGDPWLITLPSSGEGPLHDDLVRFGEFTLHLLPSGTSANKNTENLRDGWWEGTNKPGLFVRSPLYSAFPLALECLLREKLACLDRTLFIAEVVFIHRFDDPSS